MITNDTYLNQVNLQELIDLGLNKLQVSIYTVNKPINLTHKNTDLKLIMKNLVDVVSQYPQLKLVFSTVINSVSSKVQVILLTLAKQFT